jgi:hypothetical protein
MQLSNIIKHVQTWTSTSDIWTSGSQNHVNMSKHELAHRTSEHLDLRNTSTCQSAYKPSNRSSVRIAGYAPMSTAVHWLSVVLTNHSTVNNITRIQLLTLHVCFLTLCDVPKCFTELCFTSMHTMCVCVCVCVYVCMLWNELLWDWIIGDYAILTCKPHCKVSFLVLATLKLLSMYNTKWLSPHFLPSCLVAARSP